MQISLFANSAVCIFFNYVFLTTCSFHQSTEEDLTITAEETSETFVKSRKKVGYN